MPVKGQCETCGHPDAPWACPFSKSACLCPNESYCLNYMNYKPNAERKNAWDEKMKNIESQKENKDE